MARRNRRGRAVHGVLLLDKPSGGSSNHALQRVKRLFGARKAGHTGSLDPLATGMLPICLGEATKLAAWSIEADKGYETTLRLGVTTDSADADGEVIEERPVPRDLDRRRVEEVCRAFVGAQSQVPPMVSAIKVDGQRLYKLAREGVIVERAPRPVTIHRLEVLDVGNDTARLSVQCSKGTYIRSLVTDIGEALGCGAHVTALRRTYVAPFGGGGGERTAESTGQGSPRPALSMVTLVELERLASEADDPDEGWRALDALLLPPDAGLAHLPELTLPETGLVHFRRGQAVRLETPVDPPSDSPAGHAGAGRAGDGHEVAASTSVGEGVTESSTERSEPEPRSGSEPLPWRVREASGRLAGLGRLSADGSAVAPFRVLQWE